MKTVKLNEVEKLSEPADQPEMVMVDKKVLDLLNDRIKVLEQDRIPSSALLAPEAYALFGGGSRDDLWRAAHQKKEAMSTVAQKNDFKRNALYAVLFIGIITISLMLHFN